MDVHQNVADALAEVIDMEVETGGPSCNVKSEYFSKLRKRKT